MNLFKWCALVALVVTMPASAAERTRVVVLGVGASDAKLKQLADSIAEQVLTELGRSKRVDAMGTSDMAAVLGLERQKAVLGCSDQSASCLAEISAALGAPYLVTGNLARAGKATRIDLKLIRAQDGKAIYRDGRNFKDESEMFDLVSEIVKTMVAEMNLPAVDAPRKDPVATVKPPEPPLVTPKPADPKPEVTVESPADTRPGPRLMPWVVTGAGGLALAGGAVWALAIRNTALEFNDTKKKTMTGVDAAKVVADSHWNEQIVAGTVLAGAGAVALAGGLVWALGSKAEEAPQVTFVPGSNTLLVGGAW